MEPLTNCERLYTIDELTGLIYAYALMRPTKLEGMKVKSLKKKWKDKSFAGGVDRSIVQDGAERLGMELSEVMNETIKGMQAVADTIGL